MLPKLNEKEKAIQLREQGESVRVIAKKLGVSVSSVCTWTRDVRLTEEQQTALFEKGNAHYLLKKKAALVAGEAIRTKARELREQHQERGREDARSLDPLHMQGCMLYWAEGGKNTNAVRLVNTDANLVKHFVKFLRHCYDVNDDEIKLLIRAHSGNGVGLEDIQKHWLDVLGLSPENVTSISFAHDKRAGKSGRKKNIHLYGSCEVAVYRAEVVQRIFGSIQEYAGFLEPKWLERKRG